MAQKTPPQQHVTSTGIRIVGSPAVELARQASALALEPPAPADLLWVARFRARPRLGSGSPVPAILQGLTEALRADWDACPALTRDRPVSRPSDRFRGLSWDIRGESGAWRGELIWRHRHPTQGAVPCTTHLVVDEQHHLTTLTLGVAAQGGSAGVRGMVGAGQARPALLDRLRMAVHLTADGSDGSPTLLSEGEVEPFVREVMLSESRDWPVAVLAPLEDGTFMVPPEELSAALFGLAPLYVLARHACTFRLTDAIGDRRLSAYFGALRVYRPEFSCADRSSDHWLLLGERVEDPLERLALLGQIGRFAVSRFAPIVGLSPLPAETEATPAAPAAPSAAAPRSPAVQPSATAAVAEQVREAMPAPAPTLPGELQVMMAGFRELLAEMTARVGDVADAVRQLGTAQAQLTDELTRFRTATAIRAASNRAVERQLARIEARVAPQPAEGEAESAEVIEPVEAEEAEGRPTLVEVVRHAASEYADGLLILESAERAAADSPFEDVESVGSILQGMALVSRRRQEGGLETGLKAAFGELGLDYRSKAAKSTSARLRQQFLFTGPDGRVHECFEHLAVGGTYDPRRCLRIYFTSRSPGEPRFVIGHVGRHLKVMTSS